MWIGWKKVPCKWLYRDSVWEPLALCSQSERGSEAQEVMGLMVSWNALSVTYLALAHVQQNLGEGGYNHEPWLLLLESKRNKKCSVHLVFKKSINGTQSTPFVLVLYGTLGSQCLKEQKAPNPDERLEMQHRILLCYRVLIPNNMFSSICHKY